MKYQKLQQKKNQKGGMEEDNPDYDPQAARRAREKFLSKAKKFKAHRMARIYDKLNYQPLIQELIREHIYNIPHRIAKIYDKLNDQPHLQELIHQRLVPYLEFDRLTKEKSYEIDYKLIHPWIDKDKKKKPTVQLLNIILHYICQLLIIVII